MPLKEELEVTFIIFKFKKCSFSGFKILSLSVTDAATGVALYLIWVYSG